MTRIKERFLFCKEQILLIRKRNKIIAHYLDIPAKKNKVNLYEYHPEKMGYDLYENKPYNLGDYLGGVIINHMLEKANISIDKEVTCTKHLNSVGSNLFCSYQDVTVWGSGIMCQPSRSQAFFQKLSRRKLDIRAVRGPLTREILMRYGYNCPIVYGDPAILMPFIYNPSVSKQHKYSIILQFAHERKFREKHPDERVISMNTNDYKSVINEICASEIIYTSSLHGIVLAEAFGVPAVFFRGLRKSIDFKYRDWYESTGRKDIHFCDSFGEALETLPPPIPDLSKLQQGLLDTFPYDLWEPDIKN